MTSDLPSRWRIRTPNRLVNIKANREIGWCSFHKAGGEIGLDCWGAGLNGQDACLLKPMLLVDMEVDDDQ